MATFKATKFLVDRQPDPFWPGTLQTDSFNVLFWDTPITVGGEIKVWTGSVFALKPVKYWNGSAWVTKPIKRWTGSAWV